LALLLSACLPSDDLLRQVNASPSDPTRAAFVAGNVTTCAGVGLGTSIQVGADGNAPASDANVSGTPAPNSGPVQPGVGEEVDVAITGAGVVVDAVVVKGGPAYNLYTNPTFLPPTLGPPQHYLSPLNGGGNVPTISHWFVCYHLGTPPASGSLTVLKVVSVDQVPATPLPDSYTALVNCDDGVPAHENITVTMPGGGGVGTPSLTGIPQGTVCTVVEQDTGSFPPGSTVTYDPVGADTTGVTVGAGAGVEVTITNEFTNVPPAAGTLQVTKTLVPPGPGITVPAAFFIPVVCDDGTRATVVVPGSGGIGTPTVTASAGALCSLEEFGASQLPLGWAVRFSVNGGPPTTTLPTVEIVENQTVAITVINDAAGVLAETVTREEAGTVNVQPTFTG
jgi:hypothetical protein